MIPPGSRPVAALILAASLGALAFALTAQYVFGLLPCILCLYQRVPYAVVALLAAGALLPRTSPRSRLALIALCGLAFLVDSGIAMYHVGVEHHWWAGTSTCSGDGAGNATLTMTPEQLLVALNKPAEVRCDEPAFAMFGVTMAGYNALLALVLGLATLAAAWKLRAQA